jgi:hypothetical protein
MKTKYWQAVNLRPGDTTTIERRANMDGPVTYSTYCIRVTEVVIGPSNQIGSVEPLEAKLRCWSEAKTVLGIMSCTMLMKVPPLATVPIGYYTAALSRCEWDAWHQPEALKKMSVDPLVVTERCLRIWLSEYPARVSKQPAFNRAEAPALLFKPELPAPVEFQERSFGG